MKDEWPDIRSWAGEYHATGELAVELQGRHYAVALPDRWNVSLQTESAQGPWPPRLQIIGTSAIRSGTPQPTTRRLVVSSGQPDVSRLEELAEWCPAVSWVLQTVDRDDGRITRMLVSVPNGPSTTTWPLWLDKPLPWPSAGKPRTTLGVSGDQRFEVTAAAANETGWNWRVEAVSDPAPWLSWCELELVPDTTSSPGRLDLSFRSEAPRDPALQSRLQLSRT